GSVSLTAQATARTGLTINNVQFTVDGVNQGVALTTAPYTITLDTTKLSNGPHSVIAIATDSSAQTSTSTPVTINVSNAGSAAALITGFVPGSVRNDYSGWIG